MRLAWFSPVPPVPSGIASCTADLVAALSSDHEIDVYVDEPVAKLGLAIPGAAQLPRSAHDFVWRHRLRPYDLTVYQLGNSSHHDFLWPYLFRYPGLSVLHDAHLHHARAATLLRTKRPQDYRAEFVANHPGANQDLAELAIAGFDNFLYYQWPMTRLIVQASRMTLVHSSALAVRLQAEVPGAPVRTVRLGHGEFREEGELAEARVRVRSQRQLAQDAVVFGVFGGLTPEKRVPQVLDAFESLLPYAPDAHLLLAGSAAEHYDVAADVQRRGLGTRTTITGYLETDRELTDCIAACDVALNLRWPTAREVSGPWLRALAAGRATVVMDLDHLADVPSLDPRTWTVNSGGDSRQNVVCVAIDVMDEAHSLRLAMRRLASDPELRQSLGAAGRAYWQREHSVEGMVADYRAALADAIATPVPRPTLPSHLVNDGEDRLNLLLADVGVSSLWDKL
jgi:glycosyltransferase involved in cell wall biosynthesis